MERLNKKRGYKLKLQLILMEYDTHKLIDIFRQSVRKYFFFEHPLKFLVYIKTQDSKM